MNIKLSGGGRGGGRDWGPGGGLAVLVTIKLDGGYARFIIFFCKPF